MTRMLRRNPVTVAVATLFLAANCLTGAIVRPPSPSIRQSLGLGAEQLILGHDALTLITSVLLANGPAEAVVALAAIILGVGASERHLGSPRTIAAFAATAVAGGLLGTAAQAAGLLTHGVWSTPPADLQSFHPFTPIAGTVMTASAFVGPLWRRRIRVLGFGGLAVVLLYSGQPGDFYRLAGALVGLVLGLVLARKRPRRTWLRSSHHEMRSLLAVLVAMGAVGPVLALFQRSGYGLLRPLGLLFRDPLPLPSQIRQACIGSSAARSCAREVLLGRLNSPGTIALDVLPLIVLLAAAAAMLYGRRAGAWVAIGVDLLLALLAGIYYNLFPVLVDPDQFIGPAERGAPTLQTFLAMLLPLALAVAVAVNLRHFGERTRRLALLVSAGALAAVVLLGAGAYVTLGILAPASFTPHVAPLDLLLSVPERYVPVGFLRSRRLDFAPATPLSAALSSGIGAAAWFVLLLGTVTCGIAVRRPRTAAEESRLRALLLQGATGSISYMSTWAGNRYWFSADGRHAIAFREGSGVALTVGEPIGPDDGAVAAAREFAISCDDRGLTPAFYSVRESFAQAIGGEETPWASAEIGEDTVLDPRTFSLKGKRWKDVRSSINRADRLGVRAVWTDWNSLSVAARSQVEAISEEWIADRRLPELGFTLGGLDELKDREVKLMLAVGPGEHISAVTSWLPTWRDGEIVGWTLEFMRRRSNSMNGVMEFLIASVVTAAQQRGLSFVSLSVAPLARSTPGEEANRVERVLEALGRQLEPVYGFTSLAAFKEKFQPVHVPQLLVYADAVSLPQISIAIARAYLPDLGLPAIFRLLGALVPDQGSADRDGERIAAGERSAAPPPEPPSEGPHPLAGEASAPGPDDPDRPDAPTRDPAAAGSRHRS